MYLAHSQQPRNPDNIQQEAGPSTCSCLDCHKWWAYFIILSYPHNSESLHLPLCSSKELALWWLYAPAEFPDRLLSSGAERCARGLESWVLRLEASWKGECLNPFWWLQFTLVNLESFAFLFQNSVCQTSWYWAPLLRISTWLDYSYLVDCQQWLAHEFCLRLVLKSNAEDEASSDVVAPLLAERWTLEEIWPFMMF